MATFGYKRVGIRKSSTIWHLVTRLVLPRFSPRFPLARAQPHVHVIIFHALMGPMVSDRIYIVGNTYMRVPSHLLRVLCGSSTWLLVFGWSTTPTIPLLWWPMGTCPFCQHIFMLGRHPLANMYLAPFSTDMPHPSRLHIDPLFVFTFQS